MHTHLTVHDTPLHTATLLHTAAPLHTKLYIHVTTHHVQLMLPSLLSHEDEVEEQANKSQHHSHPSQC